MKITANDGLASLAELIPCDILLSSRLFHVTCGLVHYKLTEYISVQTNSFILYLAGTYVTYCIYILNSGKLCHTKHKRLNKLHMLKDTYFLSLM
jgi:hypothetical protein